VPAINHSLNQHCTILSGWLIHRFYWAVSVWEYTEQVAALRIASFLPCHYWKLGHVLDSFFLLSYQFKGLEMTKMTKYLYAMWFAGLPRAGLGLCSLWLEKSVSPVVEGFTHERPGIELQTVRERGIGLQPRLSLTHITHVCQTHARAHTHTRPHTLTWNADDTL
jgi:hypothetical protein